MFDQQTTVRLRCPPPLRGEERRLFHSIQFHTVLSTWGYIDVSYLGVDVSAGDDDEVLQPSLDEQEPAVVDAGEVSGPQKLPIAEERIPVVTKTGGRNNACVYHIV